MSRPTEEHPGLAHQVLMYLKGALNNKLTFRPAGYDGFTEADVSLLSFSDSDWACTIDTRRSHGCHLLMFGGATIVWRSKLQKSVMLSTASAEYQEASEACREITFVQGILKDFYGAHYFRHLYSSTTRQRSLLASSPNLFNAKGIFRSESAIRKNALPTSSSK